MKKTTKTIGHASFLDLKGFGHAVPRMTKNGNQIPFLVGKEYNVTSDESTEIVRVRCTQDNPYHLILITKAN